MEAVAADFAVTYDTCAVHGYAKDTRDGYSAALRRLAVTLRQQPGATAREFFQDHLLGIIRTTESNSGVKRVLSAVRVLEKLNWVSPVACPMDSKLIEAMAVYHNKRRGGSHKFWASMQGFRSLCRLLSSPADWELVALAALSVTFGLRAKDAVTVSYDASQVRQVGAKGRNGPREKTPGPWAKRWAQLLWEVRARHGHHPGRPTWHASR